jgi:hypothetical protein
MRNLSTLSDFVVVTATHHRKRTFVLALAFFLFARHDAVLHVSVGYPLASLVCRKELRLSTTGGFAYGVSFFPDIL